MKDPLACLCAAWSCANNPSIAFPISPSATLKVLLEALKTIVCKVGEKSPNVPSNSSMSNG